MRRIAAVVVACLVASGCVASAAPTSTEPSPLMTPILPVVLSVTPAPASPETTLDAVAPSASFPDETTSPTTTPAPLPKEPDATVRPKPLPTAGPTARPYIELQLAYTGATSGDYVGTVTPIGGTFTSVIVSIDLESANVMLCGPVAICTSGGRTTRHAEWNIGTLTAPVTVTVLVGHKTSGVFAVASCDDNCLTKGVNFNF